MRGHFHRRFAAGALGVALLVVGLSSAGAVSADISPIAFQKLGCNNGDLACFQARLNGTVPLTMPYCNGTQCTSVPVGESFPIAAPVPTGNVGVTPGEIDPLAYQKLGCNNGDLTCFYARLNGSVPLTTPYCNGTSCTSVPVGDPGASIVPPAPLPTDPTAAPVTVTPSAQGPLMPALYR